MDQVAKPSGFADSVIPEKNSERPRVRKPSPPNESQLEAKTSMSPTRDNPDSDLRGFVVVDRPPKGQNEGDFGFRNAVNMVKSLDANRYATKKTIAQGMLDIALLTANASQLKYILQVGKQHEFYTLMLTLICVSISLQILQGIICILLGSNFNINKTQDQHKANIWNNITLALMLLTVAVNVIISAFEMRSSDGIGTNSTKALLTQTVIR